MPGDDAIKIKMPQSPAFAEGDSPAGDDLVWVWDSSTGTLRFALVSTLPFGAGGDPGAGSGDTSGIVSPWIIQNDDPAYSYDEGTGNVTITDERLLNRSLYPVATTQFGGGEFKLAQLEFHGVSDDDDTKGALVITGFELEDGEHITITLPSTGSTGDSVYTQLIADVAELKRITAVFKPTALGANGGKVWWPSNDPIPAGWQECTAMRGLVPVGQDTAQAEFNAMLATGGSKSKKLAVNNIPQLTTTIQRPKLINDVDRGAGGSSKFSLDDIETVNVTVGTADADQQSINLLNPYKVGKWIEYVGV